MPGPSAREETVMAETQQLAREYELIYILRPSVSPSEARKVADRVTDVIDKRGAFFRYNDGLIGQGRENAKQYLRDNPELAYELEMLIRESYKIMPLTATFSSNGDSSEAEDAVTPLEDEG